MLNRREPLGARAMTMKLKSLAAAIERQLPTLRTRATSGGIEVALDARTFTIPRSAIHERLGGKRARARLIDAKEPFVDLASGTLHLHDNDVFVLVSLDLERSRMTPLHIGILAALSEDVEETSPTQAPMSGAALRRHLKILVGLDVTEMSVNRFLRSARAVGAVISRKDSTVLDRSRACDVIADEFEMDRIGVPVRYAVAERSAIDAFVKERFPSCIHGLSRAIASAGIHVAEDDLVASREIEPAFVQRFGAAVDDSCRGKTVIVRFTNKTPPAIFAGVNARTVLNPLLAAAHAMKTESEMRARGEEMWRRLAH